MTRRRLIRRPALLAAVVLLAAAAPARAGVQPVLGFGDRSMVIMGGASDAAPGETWGFRQLPLDIPPLLDLDGDLGFAPVTSRITPTPQLVFTRATDAAGGWEPAETPVDEQGQPYRGMQPNLRSPRITPKAGGVLVGADGTRGTQPTILARDPGGRFKILPTPTAQVLSGQGETLATDGGAGRVAVAAFDGLQHTELFAGILGPAAETAVAHWDGTSWTREPIALPQGSQDGFRILAIDARARDNAWMLAKTASSLGDGVVLLERQPESDGTATWRKRDLGAPAFASASDSAAGTSGVAVLGDDAQPLTVGPDGLWIDGTVTGGSATGDVTLFYDRAAGRVTRTSCDVAGADGSALCGTPLGFRFGRRGGYRSFAYPDGRRVVTNPLSVGGDDSTNLGSWETWDGAGWRRHDGAGGNLRPSGGFATPDHGWLEGPVEVTDTAAPSKLATWPVSVRSPFTAVVTAPGATPGDPQSQALAVGASGGVARYLPGTGWQREFLLTSTGAVTSPTLRSVAWPETGRAYAVGDLGAMWLWRADTGLWERDPAAPIAFDGNLLGVAFDPADAQRGYAVGRTGVLLRYDKTWTQELLPAGYGQADLTSVAFAGSQAIVAAGGGLLINDGSGWSEDESARRLLDAAPATARILTVAGLPDGGAVAAGRDIVMVRDRPGSDWRLAAAPLPGGTVVAAAATRAGDVVKAVVAFSPDVDYPASEVLPLPDPNVPPPVLPPFGLPADGYVLHETDRAWRDEQRMAFPGTTDDRPTKADPVLAFSLDPDGRGWAVGGWSGQPDNAGRGAGIAAIRARVQTGQIQRYDPAGSPLGPPGAAADPVALDTGVVTFAVAGHATCAEACSRLAAQGLGPDRNAQAVVSEASDLASRAGGPRALLYTGGRLPTTGTQTVSDADQRRLAEVLGGGQTSVPVYGAVSAADSDDAIDTPQDQGGGSTGASGATGASGSSGSSGTSGTSGGPGAPGGSGSGATGGSGSGSGVTGGSGSGSGVTGGSGSGSGATGGFGGGATGGSGSGATGTSGPAGPGGPPAAPAPGASAWRSAFAGFPAPFGRGPTPGGVSTDAIPGASTAGDGARTHYAYDSTGPSGGAIRVVVIDNGAGSLAAADAHQNPPEAQEPWLRAVLRDAKARGIPAIVVGSRDLNSRLAPRTNAATDADQIAQLLVDEGASAYLYERPEEQRASQIPGGAATTIPEFGTGTLGYRSPLSNALQPGQSDALFGDSGFLLLSIDTSRRDAATNRAPVSVRLIPLVEDLSLAAVDGTLLRRSRPALFQGLGRRPLGGDRWGPISGADGSPNPPGADPYTSFPPAPCLQATCGTRITPEYRFTSSDPDIADFVKQDPASTNLRKPLQVSGKTVTDATSGLLCAFNAGTTTVTVRAGGRAFSQTIRVLSGSVQQPCGTRPLDPSRFTRAAAPVPAVPPAAAPAPASSPAASPSPAPPPPAPPAPVPAAAPSPAPTPAKATPLVPPPPIFPTPLDPVLPPLVVARGAVPIAPPPPAAGFGRPIPPGGAVARVFEEKREEEVAPEQSSAATAYDPDDRGPVPGYLIAVVALAAMAGASVNVERRRRRTQPPYAYATAPTARRGPKEPRRR